MALEVEMERGWEWLEDAAHDLRLTGSIAMKFIVENERSVVIMLVPESEVINDPDLKTSVAQKVRTLVDSMDAHTVYHLSDAWTSTVNNASQRPELIRKIEELGIRRASDLGLIERREALMCSISTRSGEGATLRWFYRRDGKQITMEERDRPGGAMKGRFSHLFDKGSDHDRR
jgi:hypothetical protein